MKVQSGTILGRECLELESPKLGKTRVPNSELRHDKKTQVRIVWSMKILGNKGLEWKTHPQLRKCQSRNIRGYEGLELENPRLAKSQVGASRSGRSRVGKPQGKHHVSQNVRSPVNLEFLGRVQSGTIIVQASLEFENDRLGRYRASKSEVRLGKSRVGTSQLRTVQ